jgi:hypothetical protein
MTATAATDFTFNLFWQDQIEPRLLIWLAHGGDAPPVVELIDEDQCPPTETFQPMPMLPKDRPWPAGGAWMGTLPVPPEGADQVRLRLAIGGTAKMLICSRPERPPVQPPAKRNRRPRRAAPEL